MVWIMSLPKGFGEFWPDGEFEDGDKRNSLGWDGRLKAFFKELPVERQRELMGAGSWFRYGYYVSLKFISEVGSSPMADLPPITPVLEDEAPKTFNTEKGYNQLGDFIKLNDRIVAVSEEVKAIVEELDGDAHQFFPIDIVMPRSTFPKKYFTMVIANYRSSFSDVNGILPTLRKGEKHRFSSMNKKYAAQMHFRRSEFEGAHVWRERLFDEFITMFSDEIVDRLQGSGLGIPKVYQAKEFV